MNEQHDDVTTDQRPLIVGAWAVVALPLAYGLFNAVKAAAQLFTG